jgi:hypothetical protein
MKILNVTTIDCKEKLHKRKSREIFWVRLSLSVLLKLSGLYAEMASFPKMSSLLSLSNMS